MKNKVFDHTVSNKYLFTNTGAAIKSGDFVAVGNMTGVAIEDIAATTGTGVLEMSGRFKAPKQSADVIAQGQTLGYDFTNKRVTTTGSRMICTTAAGDGTTTVEVELLQPAPSGLLYSATAASAAVTTTAAQTAFDQAVSLAANSLLPGDIIRIKGQGIATATNGTDTLAIAVNVGGTEVLALAAVDVANNDIFRYEVDVVVRTLGSSGTCVAEGAGIIGAAGTATMRALFKASQTLNTTVANSVRALATWSTNNAGNSCRQDKFSVELIRPVG